MTQPRPITSDEYAVLIEAQHRLDAKRANLAPRPQAKTVRGLLESRLGDLRLVPSADAPQEHREQQDRVPHQYPIDLNLPRCPVCNAPALALAWNTREDVQHDCTCYRDHAAQYAADTARMFRVHHAVRRFRAMLPEKYRAYTFASHAAEPGNMKARAACQKLEPGGWLYLHGEAGNGKTHLAVATGLAFAQRGQRVAFWNIVALYSALKRSFDDKHTPAPDLLTPDVVILDDLGKLKPSEYAFEYQYGILESRWSNGKTTIITANHAPLVVARAMSPDPSNADAVCSRLVAGRVVEVVGEDEREGRS